MSVSASPGNSDALPPLDARAAGLAARKTSLSGKAWLQDEAAARMAQRLPLIRQAPASWVDWQPRTGGLASLALVQSVYPEAAATLLQPHAADLQWVKQAHKAPWWRFWNRPQVSYTHQLDGKADMVWSNMLLHQHARPEELMKDWCQALSPQGFVMFSCLGPDSLREMREIYLDRQWPAPHHDFTDMHDWGDMLLQAGFGQPVMDMERITLTYETAVRALQDLRAWGRNLHPQRFASLRGRAWRAALARAMESQLASPVHAGRLVLSIEIIYGHAFKAAPVAQVREKTMVSLEEMKIMLSADNTNGAKSRSGL
ncbi:MAG: methyltransferase domain-containing protein [Limnohabitans sp.]|nr:methyltransferase domain-containing protein [Limnohabitans sp.]